MRHAPPRPLAALRAAWWWVREFFGEHEYERYLADWQARHPGLDPATAGPHRPMTRREHFDFRLEIRYGGTIQRCC